MPLGKVFPYAPKKVRHLSRTQHLKPFFGKSMRLARKEKKAERKRMIRLWSDRAGKAVGKRSWGGGVACDGDGLRAKQRAVLDRTALWK